VPSKVRVILTTANGCLKGTRAVAMLYSLAKNSLFDKYLPENWKKWTKLQQMKYLADYLPEDVKLTCIREVKHTRKDKSLYVKTFVESKLPQMNEALIRGGVRFVQAGQPAQAPQQAQEVFPDAIWNFGGQAAGHIPAPVPAPNANAPAEVWNEWAELQIRRQRAAVDAAFAPDPPVPMQAVDEMRRVDMDVIGVAPRPRRRRVVRPIEDEEEIG